MQSRTLLLIEDDPLDAISILEFIGGTDFGQAMNVKHSQFVNDYPRTLGSTEIVSTQVPAGPLGKALIEILGERTELKVHLAGTKEESGKFLDDPKNLNDTVLAFLDLSIPGAEEFEVDDGTQKKTVGLAMSLFARLLELRVPVFILSAFLNPGVFEKLQQVARGRFFGFYHKDTFLDAIERSSNAQQSEANFIASLVFTKPFYRTLLQLKSDFNHDFPGSRVIANEVSRLVDRKGREEGARQAEDYKEEMDAIKDELRREQSPLITSVDDEVSTLKAVLLHEPGLETSLVTPKNCDDLLFNQPVNARKFIEQYRRFGAIISAIEEEYGTAVYTIRGLLKDLLTHDKYGQFLRAKLILAMLRGETSVEKFWKMLGFRPEVLIDVALAGTTALGAPDEPLFNPIANFMFTRDWGFTVHNTVFLSNMNKPARMREKAIARFIFEFHPLFQNMFDSEFSALSTGTIEGGDVILASPSTVLVGLSERTDFEALQEFASRVFAKAPGVETIIGTPAPREHPKSMHLDTFIGFLDSETALMYEEILVKKVNPQFLFRRKRGVEPEVKLEIDTFERVLKKELARESIALNTISVSDKGEQYDDACNIFTVSPGKALIYERVPNTIEKIRQSGWQVEEFSFDFDDHGTVSLDGSSKKRLKSLFADATSKVLIKIAGDELSLARGGPHCMTFPLSRQRDDETR